MWTQRGVEVCESQTLPPEEKTPEPLALTAMIKVKRGM